MPRITYYVAASLDGFIAGPNDELDWLPPIVPDGEDYGYKAFYASTDALVMGRGTYEVCRAFPEWPYADKPSWVMSRGEVPADLPPGVVFTQETPAALHAAWQARGFGRVFLVGGGRAAQAFLEAGLVHELIVSTIPTVLGRGIGLFVPRLLPQGATPPSPEPVRWTLRHSQAFSGGIVQGTYEALGKNG